MTIKDYLKQELKHNRGTDGANIINKIVLECIGKRPLGSVLYELDNSIRAELVEDSCSQEDTYDLNAKKEQVKLLLNMLYIDKLAEY